MDCFPTTLQELVVNGHFFKANIGVYDLLGELPELTLLNLDFNLLTFEETGHSKTGLSRFLETAPKLRNLSLANNPLKRFDEDLTAPIVVLNLAETELKQIPPHLPSSVEHLVLDGNDFANIPAFSFKECTKLTSLSLVGNKVSPLAPSLTFYKQPVHALL